MPQINQGQQLTPLRSTQADRRDNRHDYLAVNIT